MLRSLLDSYQIFSCFELVVPATFILKLWSGDWLLLLLYVGTESRDFNRIL